MEGLAGRGRRGGAGPAGPGPLTGRGGAGSTPMIGQSRAGRGRRRSLAWAPPSLVPAGPPLFPLTAGLLDLPVRPRPPWRTGPISPLSLHQTPPCPPSLSLSPTVPVCPHPLLLSPALRFYSFGFPLSILLFILFYIFPSSITPSSSVSFSQHPLPIPTPKPHGKPGFLASQTGPAASQGALLLRPAYSREPWHSLPRHCKGKLAQLPARD